MKIAIIYDIFREDTMGEYYRSTLIKEGFDVQHFWVRYSYKIKPEFDLYLRIDDGDYKYDIPHPKLKPCFFYASDVHLRKPYREIKKIARHYDHIFCAQYNGYLKLNRVYPGKISWLPHAADPKFHQDLEVKRDLDICFVGNDGGVPRKFILQALRERYPNSFIGKASHKEISRIYSRAKIVFNYSINNDINMRIFEALSCGALLITNHIKGNGFDLLFKEGEHLITYKTPKDIFRLIDYFLKEEKERYEIAKQGKYILKREHTYSHRVKEVIEMYRRVCNSKATEISI